MALNASLSDVEQEKVKIRRKETFFVTRHNRKHLVPGDQRQGHPRSWVLHPRHQIVAAPLRLLLRTQLTVKRQSLSLSYIKPNTRTISQHDVLLAELI
jgi:hypothetical protein